MTQHDLSNHIAVVTGGASGIGRATARRLAECGAQVFVGDYDPVEASTAADRQLGIEILPCDVRIESDVKNLIETAANSQSKIQNQKSKIKNPGIDILVNNAGIGLVKQITEVTAEEWDAVIDTNLKGAFLASKHAIPRMIARGGGSIVNIASNAGLLPRAHDPVYSISKQALVAMTRSLALCHSRDRIRVNAVCPGPVRDTRMMERDLVAVADRAAAESQFIAASPLAAALGRMVDPAEVAAAVLYLVSPAAALVTGTSIAIDGGKSLGVPPKARDE